MRVAAGVLLALLASAGVLVGIAVWMLQQPVGKDAAFLIPSGDNLSSMADRLGSQGLLPVSATVFKVAGLLTRDEGSIKAGEYQIESDMNALALLALFRSGRVIQYRVTFPEGWSFREWRAHLSELPNVTHSIRELSDLEVSQHLGMNGEPLEGWFFPDTYYYTRGASDLSILLNAHQKMRDELTQVWHNNISQLGDRYELLVLASIIEKETALLEDQSKIASVFHNRLSSGMKLQSDPTVIYGLGDAFDGDLKRSHLRQATAHNTYTNHGLPPTPICAPGLAALQAAAAGSQHNYLYFVSRGDGTSQFSMTLDEHNRAVNRYQRGQK